METTAYFVNPDGLPAEGMPGTALPFPVTTAFSPVITDYIPIEIPPDTNWDITYFLGNSLVEPIEAFPVPFVYSFNTAGVENAPILTYPGEGLVDERLVVNVAGAITPTISGGEPDTCTISPALPAGLTIDNATGVISGTPTVTVAAKDYTITATNTAGSTTSALRFEVDIDPPKYRYNGTVGSLFTLTKDVTNLNAFPVKIGGPDATLFFQAASLPAGLTYDASNGRISGIATVVSPNTFYSVVLEGPSGNGSTSYRIEVLGNVPVISYPSFSTPTTLLTDQIVSASPTNTGGAVTAGYAVTAGTLPAGLSLDAASGVISGSPTAITAAADITITATGADGWPSTINLTVDAGRPQFDYASHSPSLRTWPVPSPPPPVPVPSAHTLSPVEHSLRASIPAPLVRSPEQLPSAAATYMVEITATGSVALAIVPVADRRQSGAPSITYAGSPYSATEGLEFSASPTSTGGAPQYHRHRWRPARRHFPQPHHRSDLRTQPRCRRTGSQFHDHGFQWKRIICRRSADNDGAVMLWVWHSISTLSTSPVWSGLSVLERRWWSRGLRWIRGALDSILIDLDNFDCIIRDVQQFNGVIAVCVATGLVPRLIPTATAWMGVSSGTDSSHSTRFQVDIRTRFRADAFVLIHSRPVPPGIRLGSSYP